MSIYYVYMCALNGMCMSVVGIMYVYSSYLSRTVVTHVPHWDEGQLGFLRGNWNLVLSGHHTAHSPHKISQSKRLLVQHSAFHFLQTIIELSCSNYPDLFQIVSVLSDCVSVQSNAVSQ